MFNPDEPKYAQGVICKLPFPSDDTRVITKTAMAGLDTAFLERYKYSKAEVLLMHLCPFASVANSPVTVCTFTA
jgi:DNA polymerase V